MNARLALALLLAAAAPALAQDPVHFSAKTPAASLKPGDRFELLLAATVDDEWHVYSMTQGPGGPVPTTVSVGPRTLFTRDGAIAGPQPVTAFDRNFEINTETYDGAFVLRVPVRLAPAARGDRGTLQIEIGYQACTSRLCLPPATAILRLPLRWTAGEKGQLPTPNAQPPTAKAEVKEVAQPIVFGAAAGTWPAFIWLAISMGALSLLTPCVFPMVPITVSYFTNHASATRHRAISTAALYGLGIVLTFTVLGSVLASIAGAAGLNRFAANPWINLAITAVFIALALNLFGVYELRLPFRAVSQLDAVTRRTGASAAGTLLMAVTFTVTSLTCTAAFLGTLLVVAAQGEWQRPVVGLLAYSATFALPFVALAAAPQLVSRLPRSGPWLARVKVAMGFLEIAAAMKFLSNADLVWSWGLFTRSVILASWIAIAVALAVFIVGRRPAVARLAAAGGVLFLAGWLAAGLAGRGLGELEAFLPPRTVHAASRGELPWITDNLDAALREARATRRNVFIDFTGYTCTNCRWMETNMFPRAEVRERLQGFVRARLYTDGRGDVYERQQRYQQDAFKTVALPLYAIVDPDRRPIATFAGLTRDASEFLRFLDTAR